MKFIGKKAIFAVLIAAGMAGTMPVMTVSAVEDSNVLSSTTFTATVTRTTTGALLVTPDASANLGDSLAVTYSKASDFAVGDVVTITYSGEVTDAGNGTMKVSADSISKASNAEATATEAVTTAAEKPEKTDTADNTSTPTVTGADTTPNTGDTGVMVFATAGVLSGTALILKKAGKKE